MKEDLLHFVWRYRLYDAKDLCTTTGEKIEVLQPGTYNTDAGADFSNARIRIGNITMAGNVEMHVDQSDWYAHHHEKDKAYNNVILHVVYDDHGAAAQTESGHVIPVLSLKRFISAELLHRYELLRTNKKSIPCEPLISRLSPDFSYATFYDRLVIDRLQAKVAVIENMLAASTGDWDQVAFQMVATYFGGSVNKEPFQLLASSLPLTVIHRHRNQPQQIEALLFGQSGLLNADFDDEYPAALKREYNYLKKLHSLTPLEAHSWKFFRVRPASFPTVKIAQLAAWLSKEQHPFRTILDAPTLEAMRSLFDIEIHEYWHTHYQFDKPAKKSNASMGSMLTDVLLINAIVPILFSYGRYKDDEAICQRALDLLTEISAEDNAIIRMWDKLGLKALTANDSQALLQLYNQNCLNHRCLSCQVGHTLLSPAKVSI